MIKKRTIILLSWTLTFFFSISSIEGGENSTGIISKIESAVKKDSLEFAFYQESANLVLEKFETDITGEMLAISWKKTRLKTKIDVPVYLALAQAFLESGFGRSKLSRLINNPYSIRSSNGGYKKFKTLQEGINFYYFIVASKYLSCKSLENLLSDFSNCKGYRYAEDSTYETRLRKTMKKFSDYKFK